MSRAAIVIGATGGIGAAIANALEDEDDYDVVLRFGRSLQGEQQIDVTDDTSVERAAKTVKASGHSPELVFVATGLLHDQQRGPEKQLKDLNSEWLAQNYLVNSIGPALVAKHFMPMMPRDKLLRFAALSARVGSISDNHLGGWYGYRAAKAALNQLIRTAAIEWQRTHKRSIAVALHPGTVDTQLSAPFQGNVPPGQLFDTERAALQLLDVLDGLKPGDSGKIFAWDGSEITP